MIEDIIREYIPEKLTKFKYLNKDINFYYFSNFENDKLKYTFPKKNGNGKNIKCIYLREFSDLLEFALTLQNHTLFRTHFEFKCKKSNSSGQCGYCIMVRIIEMLKIGIYLGHGKGVKIIDKKRLTELLNK